MRSYARLFVFVLMLLGACSFDPGPELANALKGSATARDPMPAWVEITPAADCSQGCWRLVSADYWDVEQSAGLHHVFARALDAGGSQLENIPLTVAWADGSVTIPTKAAPDWTDAALWDCFNPDRGEVGGYSAWVGDRAQSDTISGMGLPVCLHVSYALHWQWNNGGEIPTPSPTVSATLTSTPAPTATVTPCATCRRLYLPVVRR